jgi:uncharacterized membrane protein
VRVERAERFGGPLPHPEVLRQYDEIVPGAANRILLMAEQQEQHRHSLEKTVVEGGDRRAWWGLWIGALVFTLFLGVSAALVFAGHGLPGVALGAIDIGGVVSAFVIGQRNQSGERIRKAQASS